MAHEAAPNAVPVAILRAFMQRSPVWLATAAAGLGLAVVYVLFVPGYWQAVQSFMVRNEAVNNHDGPGRFRQENEMKTTQETIMEIALSRSVAEAALAAVGPPTDWAGHTAWPSEDDIVDLQDAIQVVPPKGTEFGKSEIFYLKIKDHDRDRAIALVTAVCDQLQAKLRSVRETKAQGLIAELTKAAALAEADLASATASLAAIEQQVGGNDLAELRMLDANSIGDSDLRRNLNSIEAELRDARNTRQAQSELLTELTQAQENPGRLLATPNRLLESQPALRRLKDGLVDAQLRTSQLMGSMSSVHPQVINALAAEQEISVQIDREIGAAVRGVEVEMRLAAGRIERLEQQQADTLRRLDRLAGLRAEYSNLTSAARHQNSLLEKARHDLAEARGSLAGAINGSLVARIDGPNAGNRRVGPRKAVILFAGLMGGLLGGFGLVFMTMPWPHARGPAVGSVEANVPTMHNDYGWPELDHSVTHGGLSLQQASRTVVEQSV
jgi:polysaccharide biosynthesis transport protein